MKYGSDIDLKKSGHFKNQLILRPFSGAILGFDLKSLKDVLNPVVKAGFLYLYPNSLLCLAKERGHSIQVLGSVRPFLFFPCRPCVFTTRALFLPLRGSLDEGRRRGEENSTGHSLGGLSSAAEVK